MSLLLTSLGKAASGPSKKQSTSTPSAAGRDVLVRRRKYNGKTRRWSDWEEMLVRPTVVSDAGVASRTRSKEKQDEQDTPSVFSFPLTLGGSFRVYPNLLSTERQEEIADELMENGHLFRQYRIQGTNEPRAHFLLHKDATDDENAPQPGYRYGANTTMMARPLRLCPKTERLAAETEKLCGVEWNIGANAVLYRGSRDHIGNHADDDQGEQKILTVLISSPTKPRGVIFQRKPRKLPSGKKSYKREDGDEQWELNLGAGDAYDMDGEMQEYYFHGVPAAVSPNNSASNRLVLVFRSGTYTEYTKDTGRPSADLAPRQVIPRTFGRMKGLIEGNSYHRSEMSDMGAHRSPQGGVSGHIKHGCDSIVVAGARPDGLGHDNFKRLIYAAETSVGGGSILLSMLKDLPIRVFRSSGAPNSPYRALSELKGSCRYRYDGLYIFLRVIYRGTDGRVIMETRENLSEVVAGRLYLFELERVAVGQNSFSNQKTVEELVNYSITNKTMGVNARAALDEPPLYPTQAVTLPPLGPGVPREGDQAKPAASAPIHTQQAGVPGTSSPELFQSYALPPSGLGLPRPGDQATSVRITPIYSVSPASANLPRSLLTPEEILVQMSHDADEPRRTTPCPTMTFEQSFSPPGFVSPQSSGHSVLPVTADKTPFFGNRQLRRSLFAQDTDAVQGLLALPATPTPAGTTHGTPEQSRQQVQRQRQDYEPSESRGRVRDRDKVQRYLKEPEHKRQRLSPQGTGAAAYPTSRHTGTHTEAAHHSWDRGQDSQRTHQRSTNEYLSFNPRMPPTPQKKERHYRYPYLHRAPSGNIWL